MKSFTRIALLTLFVLSGQRTLAQPPPGPESSRGGPAQRGSWRGGGPDGSSPVQRWMRDLQQNDPERFERLQQLRMENPEAFRTEAREAMTRRALDAIQRDRPGVYESLMQWPQEDRDWIVDRVARIHAGQPPRPDVPPKEASGVEREERQEVRRAIHQYRASTDEEEKSRIRESLRARLSEEYDRRLKDREDQLRDAERKLEKVREALTQGLEDKERFIDEKISVWLDADPPARREDRRRPKLD